MKSFYKGKIKIADSHWERFCKFKGRFKDCKLCGLDKTRKRVVHFRGSLPADVALIGEAPGEAEDSIGIPFCGPAGYLLDKIIQAAAEKFSPDHPQPFWEPVSVCVFNVVCCFPRTIDPEELSSGQIREPDREEMEACRPRLEEFLELVNPRRIVALGAVAKKRLPLDAVPMIHPAAILRQSEHKSGLSFKRSVLTLADVFKSVARETALIQKGRGK